MMRIYRTTKEVSCPFCDYKILVIMWFKNNYHLQIKCQGCNQSYHVHPQVPYIAVKITDVNGKEITKGHKEV